MILGIGIDLLDVRRVSQELQRRGWSQDDGIFTVQEIQYCSSSRQPALWFGKCFAAKEATLKALGLRVRDLAMFREIEVQFFPAQPQLILHKRPKTRSTRMGVRHIRLSLAQSSIYAVASVVLES